MILEILGIGEDPILTVNSKCSIIEKLLKEHKIKYLKGYSYGLNRRVVYSTRNTMLEEEHVLYDCTCPSDLFYFILYLYNKKINELLNFASMLQQKGRL